MDPDPNVRIFSRSNPTYYVKQLFESARIGRWFLESLMTARTMAGSKPLMSVLSYFDINNFDVRLIQPKSRLSLLS